ncbi:MAG: rod shape-determining protein MreD [Bacteroidales bacterium]
MNSVVKYTLFFILILILQSVIFNKIVLFGVATPMMIVYYIIKLPIKLNRIYALTVVFLLGLSVDIFANTLGMNALASVLTLYFRKPIMRIFYDYETETNSFDVNIRRGGAVNFLKYTITLAFVYCFVIFVIQSFTLFDFWSLLFKIIFSTVLTTVIIIAFESINISSGGKRL